MLAFAREGLTHGGKGLGKRKDIGRDQQIGILRPDRVPIDAFGCDGYFRQQIRACQRDAMRCRTTQHNTADHPVRLADLARVQEVTEFLGLLIATDGRRQPHTESSGPDGEGRERAGPCLHVSVGKA
jgi:hypothetical protein